MSEGTKIYVCCNSDCNLKFSESELVTMKHGDKYFCPECHEVVEEIDEDEWYKELGRVCAEEFNLNVGDNIEHQLGSVFIGNTTIGAVEVESENDEPKEDTCLFMEDCEFCSDLTCNKNHKHEDYNF